jgi:hypothetical protein
MEFSRMASVHTDTPRARGDGDAPHLSPVTPDEDVRTILINRVSWGAVIAGVVIALFVQLVLNLLGIGLGAASFDPATSDNPSATTFSIGAGIWWAVSGILAALAGGYAAGRLAGEPKESSAAWHGLTAWALTTLLVFYLLTTTIGSVVGGAFRTFGNLAAGAAQTLGTTAQTAVQAAAPSLSGVTDPFSAIERSLRDASGGNDPAALRDAAISALRALVTGGPQQQQDARERAAQAIAKAQNVSVEEARSQLARYEEQYRDTVARAKQQATAAAETATKTVSRGALFGAIALVLGALAGWFGGRMGAVEPTITSSLQRGTRQLH